MRQTTVRFPSADELAGLKSRAPPEHPLVLHDPGPPARRHVICHSSTLSTITTTKTRIPTSTSPRLVRAYVVHLIELPDSMAANHRRSAPRLPLLVLRLSPPRPALWPTDLPKVSLHGAASVLPDPHPLVCANKRSGHASGRESWRLRRIRRLELLARRGGRRHPESCIINAIAALHHHPYIDITRRWRSGPPADAAARQCDAEGR